MADYSEFGYAVERFEVAVSRRFHCSICLNVFKDPVMCYRNQHSFCRGCITRHLTNFQTCPVCMDPLTVDTLSDAPRILTDYLSELRVSCDYCHRGCKQYVKLDDLERHVNDCGFAPVVCSNEGCIQEVNKSELVYHETMLCERRVAKCHDCEYLTHEVGELKRKFTVVNSKLDEMQPVLNTTFTCLEKLMELRGEFGAFEKNLSVQMQSTLDQFGTKLHRLEAIECQLQEHNQQMKTRFVTMSEPLAKLSRLETDQSSKVSHNQVNISQESNASSVVIAGGSNNGKTLNSVEKFSLSTRVWSKEQAMQTNVCEASSVFYHDQMIISGGRTNLDVSDEIGRRNIRIKSAQWAQLSVPLPTKLRGHCTVVYKDNLYVIGGCSDSGIVSNEILEIQLVSPYKSRLLARLPDGMVHHSAQLFNERIVIVGRFQTSWSYRNRLCSVFLYDISKNQLEQLAPVVSSAVQEMATVRLGDNIIIIGGIDVYHKPLKTVVMYNMKTQFTDVLPNMNYFRRGCVAAVLGNSILAIGGATQGLKSLNTVECFDFKRFTWQEFPSMNEARYLATSVTL